jgi:hypothetical protein
MYPAGIGYFTPCPRCNAPTGEGYHGFSLMANDLLNNHGTFCPTCRDAWQNLITETLGKQAQDLFEEFLLDEVEPSVKAEIKKCIGAGPWPGIRGEGCGRYTTRIFDGVAICDTCELCVQQWEKLCLAHNVDWPDKDKYAPKDVVDKIRDSIVNRRTR